jgi:hypothetical protein
VAGPPIGIDRLLASLERARSGRQAVYRKALTDLALAASALVESSSGARGVDFETRWAHEVASAVDLAREGRAAGGAHDVAAFVTELANEIDGETGVRLQELAVEAHASFLDCLTAARGSTAEPEAIPRSWMARFRGRARPMEPGTGELSLREDLVTRVDEVIGNPIRQLLVQRGRAHAAITELALALGDLERRDT